MVEWAEEEEHAQREADGLEPVFLNKAARRRRVVELSQAVREASAAAKREYKAKMKRAWFKPENTPSCAVITSILGYDR